MTLFIEHNFYSIVVFSIAIFLILQALLVFAVLRTYNALVHNTSIVLSSNFFAKTLIHDIKQSQKKMSEIAKKLSKDTISEKISELIDEIQSLKRSGFVKNE